jgi:hypothetical protein
MDGGRRDESGHMNMIGYRHWPKYGFNASMEAVAAVVAKKSVEVPKEFEKCKDLLDVYATPGGQKWWAENGDEIKLVFDNSSNNTKSRATLDNAIRKARDKFGGK